MPSLPAITDVNGILTMYEMNPFFERVFSAPKTVDPTRQPGFESEGLQMRQSAKIGNSCRCFFCPKIDQLSARQHNLFGDIVQHHRAAVRTRQGSDQHAMKAPRWHSAYCARGVASQPVGDQPFSREQGLPALMLLPILG